MVNQARLAEVLTQFAAALLTDSAVEEILEALSEGIVEVLPVAGVGVMLADEDHRLAAVTATSPEIQRAEELQQQVGEGPCLQSFRTAEQVLSPDLRTEHRWPTYAARMVAAGYTAVYALPMQAQGHAYGALDLYQPDPIRFGPPELAAAQVLIDVATAYLRNARNVIELRQAHEQLRHLAMHDALTGLPNRALLIDRLQMAIAAAPRANSPVAVLFVDLDRFKMVNDSLGHQAGDQLLIALAERLRGQLRPGDTLARIGGDEFVVLCPNLSSSLHATTIARRMLAACGRPFTVGADMLVLTASVGVTFVSEVTESAEAVLREADAAMYRAKHRGGNGLETVHDDARLRARRQRSTERELRGGLERDELCLVYQPITTTDGGRVVGLEALLRWQHPRRGLLTPDEFLPLAEETGLTWAIGQWGLTEACATAARLQAGDSPLRGVPIAVNLSPRQLLQPGLVDLLTATLRKSRLRPASLSLEVTETVMLDNGEESLAVLRQIRDLGVGLAIDDFGTGYSSLGYLKRYPVDVVKVDRSCVTGLGTDPDDSATVAAVIHMAHDLGLRVIAEGVETSKQLAELSALGCDWAQGYYLSYPQPVERLLSEISVGGVRPSP